MTAPRATGPSASPARAASTGLAHSMIPSAARTLLPSAGQRAARPAAAHRKPTAATLATSRPGANRIGAGAIPAARDVGLALPTQLRARLAPIVGTRAADAARIHTGPTAHAIATRQLARAVAHGVDVFFADGQYQPGTRAGDALIAHEVAHVDQALRGLLRRPARKAMTGADHDALEAAADRAGDQLSAGADLDEHRRPASRQPVPTLVQPDAAAAKTPSTDAATDAAPAETVAAVLGAPGTKPAKPITALPPDLPRIPAPALELSADEQARVTGVQRRAGGHASATATAPTAAANVAAAEAAVAVPQEESDAHAAQKVVTNFVPRQPPSPEVVALTDRIKKLIASKRPASEEAVLISRAKDIADQAGGAVGDVQHNLDDANASYGAINARPTGPTPAAPPPIAPLPAQAQAAPIAASTATPDAVPPEQVSLDGDRDAMEAKAKAEGLDEETPREVQSGPIADSREARDSMQQLAKDGPAKAIEQQQVALGHANADMDALQLEALASLKATRAGHATGIKTQQDNLKGHEEGLRTELSDRATKIFGGAQGRVLKLLADVHDTAMKKWSTKLAQISRYFNDDIQAVKDAIRERHSGWGKLNLVHDWLAGLPDWVKEGYSDAENSFGRRVCNLILDISADVNTVIKTCDEIIAEAGRQIDEIFNQDLPASLQQWAAEQRTGFAHKLDQLHERAEATRSKFTEELVQNAGTAVQTAREKIQKLRKQAGGLWGRFLDAVSAFISDPIRFIIDGLLELVNISPKAFWELIDKIRTVISDIAWHPLRFISNLMSGVAAGFELFFKNFPKHLRKGFFDWLFGGLKDLGLDIPTEFSVKSIITFFLDLMGISWANIRRLLAEVVGEKYVAAAEKALRITELIAMGPRGILELIKERLTPEAILERVLKMAIEYVVETLIKQAALYILKLTNPVGAVLAAIETIYKIAKWIFHNAARIFHFIAAVVDALAAVVAGDIAAVAAGVEAGLALLIPPVIDFLAELIGLGDLPDQIAKIVKGLQSWVAGILRSIVKFLAEQAKRALAALGIGKDAETAKAQGKGAPGQIGEPLAFHSGKETHHLYIDVANKHATVMVASTPITASAWLDHLETQIRRTDSGEETPKDARQEIAAARSEISATRTRAEALAGAQDSAQPPTGAAEVVRREETSLRDRLENLGKLFGVAPPPLVGSIRIADSPVTISDLSPSLAEELQATRRTYLVKDSTGSGYVAALMKKNPAVAYEAASGVLTLPAVDAAHMASTANLNDLGRYAAATTGVAHVTLKKSETDFALTGAIDGHAAAIGSGLLPLLSWEVVSQAGAARLDKLTTAWTADAYASYVKSEGKQYLWHFDTFSVNPESQESGLRFLKVKRETHQIAAQSRTAFEALLVERAGSFKEAFQRDAGEAAAKKTRDVALDKTKRESLIERIRTIDYEHNEVFGRLRIPQFPAAPLPPEVRQALVALLDSKEPVLEINLEATPRMLEVLLMQRDGLIAILDDALLGKSPMLEPASEELKESLTNWKRLIVQREMHHAWPEWLGGPSAPAVELWLPRMLHNFGDAPTDPGFHQVLNGVLKANLNFVDAGDKRTAGPQINNAPSVQRWIEADPRNVRRLYGALVQAYTAWRGSRTPGLLAVIKAELEAQLKAFEKVQVAP